MVALCKVGPECPINVEIWAFWYFGEETSYLIKKKSSALSFGRSFGSFQSLAITANSRPVGPICWRLSKCVCKMVGWLGIVTVLKIPTRLFSTFRVGLCRSDFVSICFCHPTERLVKHYIRVFQ